MSDKKDEGKLLYCSFCGKSQHEVRKLIAGPSVFVCDECVELCNDIIREELEEPLDLDAARAEVVRATVMQRPLGTLDSHERVKEHIVRLLVNQALRARGEKFERLNSIVAGPCLPGLAEAIRHIAGLFRLVAVQIDVTRLTGPGYFGTKNVLDALFEAANKARSQAEYGVVIIERVEWVCNVRDHVLRNRLQTSLATLVAGTLEKLGDGAELDTRNIQFICAGDFQRPANLQQLRCSIETQGMSAPLLHEFQSVIATGAMNAEAVRRLLDGDDSSPGIVGQYKSTFGINDISFEMTGGARSVVVNEAVKRDFSTRSLQIFMEDLIIQQSYSLDDKRMIVDEAAVVALLGEIDGH